MIRETQAMNMVMDGDASVVETGARTDFLWPSPSLSAFTPAHVDRVLGPPFCMSKMTARAGAVRGDGKPQNGLHGAAGKKAEHGTASFAEFLSRENTPWRLYGR